MARESGLGPLCEGPRFGLDPADFNGQIEYYLFGDIDEAHGKALCDVVGEVAVDYRFPVTGDRQFSQCGTLLFKKRE